MHPLIERAQKESRNLLEPEALELFEAYNLPVPAYELVQTKEDASKAALRIGFPVVIKVVSPEVIHKSDVGGVKVGLESAEAVSEAWDTLMDSVKKNVEGASINGVLVCSQVEKDLECILGMTKDPQFGPALMFGLGGIFVELLKDVSFRVLPISRMDAQKMVEETKAYQLIKGIRGQQPKDMEAVVDFIMNCAKLIEENPVIEEIDINPIAVLDKGVAALDARVLL